MPRVTRLTFPRFLHSLALLAAGIVALVSTPGSAWAHGHLVLSTPAAGAHLVAPPSSLQLTFSEEPELAFTSVQLTKIGGGEIQLSHLTIALNDKLTVVATITSSLSAGPYRVRWQMAGADGHVMRGQYEFVVAAGAGVAGASPNGGAGSMSHDNPITMPPGDAGFGAGSWPYALIRWLQFAALLAIIGAVAFRQLVLRFMRNEQRSSGGIIRDGERLPMIPAAAMTAARMAAWAVVLLGATELLRLYAQSYSLHGPAAVFDTALVGPMLTRTVWGHGWILELIGIALGFIGAQAAKRHENWGVLTAAAILLAFTPAFSGHASSTPNLASIAVIADGLHVLGAGGWLGSLLMVVAAGIPAAMRLGDEERGPAVADLVNAFSPTALTCAGLVGVTGVIATWLHVGSIPGLWQTTYGRTLLVKLAVVSIVAGTGAYHWLRVKPTLGHVEGAHRVRRSAFVELAIGLVVLAVTAVLVATPTAMDLAAR
jgi:copper transport protein